MQLRWVPAVFPFVVGLAVVSVLSAYSGQGATRAWCLAAFVSSMAVVAVVVTQWLRHRDGVIDWQHGGVAYLERDDGFRVAWVDWALVVTRRGAIHVKSGRLRLETRVLCGLVPLSTFERVLTASDRAHSTHETIMRMPVFDGKAYRGSDSERIERKVFCEHAVELQTAETGETVRLMDRASRDLRGSAQQLIDRLEQRVNACLAAMPTARRRA